MKTKKSKKFGSLIAISLVLIIAFSIALSPSVSAQTSRMRYYLSTVYVSVAPPTVGVGQNVIIAFWADKLPPTALGDYGDRWTFDVNIIKPDGTNDTIKNIESDPVGAGYTNYVPPEPGTYIIQAIMQKHVIDGGQSRGLVAPNGAGWWPSGQPISGFDPKGVVFESALSMTVTLTVTTEQVPRYNETPLPTDYWTRPVYDTNRGWGATVMGQWLNANELAQFGNNGRYNPFTRGPASSHILWTKSYTSGGIAGGQATVNSSSPDNSYYSGQSYESFGGPSIVLNGKVYYSDSVNPREGWYIVDLYSGQTIEYRNTTGAVSGAGGSFSSTGSIPYGAPAFGQVLVVDNPNQHGTTGYYWVTSTGKTGTWDMYDDFKGEYICSIANVTWSETHSGRSVTKGATGTSAVGNEGSILRYNIVNLGTNAAPQWYLQVWNTSQVIMYDSYVAHDTGSGTNAHWMWRPNLNYTYNGRNGLSANASISLGLLSTSTGLPSGAAIRQVIPDDRLIVIYAGFNNGSVVLPGRTVAISLVPGQVGKELYSYNFTSPAGIGDAYGQSEQYSSKDIAFGGVNAQADIFWYQNPMTLLTYVYELSTGKLLWTSPPAPQFSFYGMGAKIVYNGQLIDCGGYGGVVQAFEAKTGKFLWNWTAPNVGLDETPYQNTPTSFGCLSGDGLLYLYSSEHSVNNPIRRDAQIWCVNASNGEQVWMLTCWPSSAPILADERLLVLDSHDQQIYCYGRGSSATTVSAPQTIPALGSSVMITGTVTDDSPYGRRDINGNIDKALKGTPAISDKDMDAWMEYMFRGRPKPTNAQGVDVELHAIDPNGNWISIGTTTSDIYGNYGIAYTPEVPGTYQIIAEFKGSNAYGPSSASTYLAIGNEAPTQAPYPVTAIPPTETYILGIGIAIIIAIAISTLLILRKK
ncbi:MAG: PQQ-like beta-propeller repeat protein [Candidatus Bathyarchaeota archaeon]|nr:PQQ-like beta-propeller repeat protein [Candidatus Bathyarchaeota archaeon]